MQNYVRRMNNVIPQLYNKYLKPPNGVKKKDFSNFITYNDSMKGDMECND